MIKYSTAIRNVKYNSSTPALRICFFLSRGQTIALREEITIWFDCFFGLFRYTPIIFYLFSHLFFLYIYSLPFLLYYYYTATKLLICNRFFFFSFHFIKLRISCVWLIWAHLWLNLRGNFGFPILISHKDFDLGVFYSLHTTNIKKNRYYCK